MKYDKISIKVYSLSTNFSSTCWLDNFYGIIYFNILQNFDAPLSLCKPLHFTDIQLQEKWFPITPPNQLFCKNTIHRNLSNIANNTLHSLRPKGTFVLTFITNRGLFSLNDLKERSSKKKKYGYVDKSLCFCHSFVP